MSTKPEDHLAEIVSEIVAVMTEHSIDSHQATLIVMTKRGMDFENGGEAFAEMAKKNSQRLGQT